MCHSYLHQHVCIHKNSTNKIITACLTLWLKCSEVTKIVHLISECVYLYQIQKYKHHEFSFPFLRSPLGHFQRMWPYWGAKRWYLQCWYKKKQDYFYDANFPKKLGPCPLISPSHFWVHILTIFILLGLILEGKSDQKEKCSFAKQKLKKTNPS